MSLVPAEREGKEHLTLIHSIMDWLQGLYLSMDFHKELLKCFTDIVSRLGTDFKEMFNVVVICKLGSQEYSYIIVNTN